MAKRKDILERVRNDKKLMSSHGITEEELNFLARGVEMFGSLKSVEDILFILEMSRHYRSQAS